MKSSKLKVLAVCFLFYYGLLHAWELAHQVRLFGKLHVISVPFLIWSAYPFFALFFTLLFFSPYDYFHNKLSTTRTAKLSPGSSELPLRGFAVIATTLLALLIPLYMYYMWKRNIEQFQPPKQSKTRNSVLGISPVRAPAVGAIARYLIEHASITPGHVFRGYTVSYFGDPAGHLRKSLDVPQTGMGWRVHVHSRPYLEAHYNNSFQEMDLWQFGIPTVEEYGQWVTKQAHFFAAHLFSSPTDAQNGAMLQIYKLNLDLLRVTGVHFVITDLELADPRLTLRARQESPTAGPIQLYEIANPNLATYSPTDITQVRTFDAAMRFLQQGSPTLEKRVSTFDAMRGPFTQISQAIMLAERDGFRVTAKSEGRSLLLLPVQYSRCLHIDHADAMDTQSSARLVRANGIQTLLAFKRHVDVRIRFNFGLFGTAQCRLQDLQDLRTIGLPD